MAGNVLLAEDSFLAAMEMTTALEALGYCVIGPAATSDQAIALLTTTPEIAFAVLDVSLRGGDCGPIIRTLRDLDKRFILVTGYAEPSLGDALLSLPPPAIIRKPFDRRSLVAAIESINKQAGNC